MPWSTALALDSYRPNSEDRAGAIATPFGHLVYVADGVGGRRGGGDAAEFFAQKVDRFAKSLEGFQPPTDFVYFLHQCDQEMSCIKGMGETTAIVASISEAGVAGAAIGDSAAWLVLQSSAVELCECARPKPWLGSGQAIARPFSAKAVDGCTLMLATDGLWKYADRRRLREIAHGNCSNAVVTQLVDAARLPSGNLQDDVAVILARFNFPAPNRAS